MLLRHGRSWCASGYQRHPGRARLGRTMSVTSLEIARREPFAGGHVFGEGGAYERIDGRLRFAVDPTQAENKVIVDLDKAPRDADGLVHFSADLCLLQPIEAGRARGRLLVEVPNRGRKGAL